MMITSLTITMTTTSPMKRTNWRLYEQRLVAEQLVGILLERLAPSGFAVSVD
jgi:hypothetical protein